MLHSWLLNNKLAFYLHWYYTSLAFNIYKNTLWLCYSFLVSSNNIVFKSLLNSVSCNMCNNASLSRSELRKNESKAPPPATKPLAWPWPGCVAEEFLVGEPVGVCGLDAGEILNSFWRNFFRRAESSKTGMLKSDDVFARLDLVLVYPYKAWKYDKGIHTNDLRTPFAAGWAFRSLLRTVRAAEQHGSACYSLRRRHHRS